MDEVDKESEELKDISDSAVTLMLGGKNRKLHIGMKGWKIISPKFSNFDKLMEMAKDDPLTFITEQVPVLIQVGLLGGEKEDIPIETIEDWLDEYGLNDLKNKVTPAVIDSMMKSLPSPKAAGKNPRKAK